MIGKIYDSARSRTKALAIKACIAGRFDLEHVFVLTSSPRSGSTLLSQVLELIPHSSVLFEPCFAEKVPEARALNFSRRPYVSSSDQWPAGEAFLRRVFEGRVVNQWTSKEMSFPEACSAQNLIVKFVRANRLLPWMCRTFDIPAPILLVRHPCAVIASHLACGWKPAQRPEAPAFIDQYPAFREALMNTHGEEEYLAAIWALDQLPPLLAARPRPWTMVTYEQLLLRPEATLKEIFRSWNLDVDMGLALSRLKVPSSVVSASGISGIDGWRKQLTGKQIARILGTVSAFGLYFYGHADEPDYAMLNSAELPAQIHRAGFGAEKLPRAGAAP